MLRSKEPKAILLERLLPALLIVSAGVVLTLFLAQAISNAFAELSEPWDGTFACRPGETYTTAECK